MKTALITGASRGIGNAIALHLKNEGYRVLGTATSSKGASKLEDQGIEGFVLDLNSFDSKEKLWEQIESKEIQISILVNNAGITRDNIVLRMSEDEWQDIMNVNLNGIFYLSKKVLKMMLKLKWGRIINITSTSASIGNRGQSNYSAAKAGVEAFTKSLAREVGKRNITINSIAPGFIDTDMTQQNGGVNTDELIKEIPLGRFGKPDEVAHLASFLCSEEASYITGQIIHINGGLYM
jgi:3-oxoacyl-[acyl-carrier protein] reductase|tara:strand:+ start:1853 stop:2563 length:711 start_codon:yes stop_codon:yes gene_type:complete